MNRNLGSSSHYFQSGFNKLCCALQYYLSGIEFNIPELLFATVLVSTVLVATVIVSLQLGCQGQTWLLAFHLVFHKEFMETQAPKNTCGRTFRWSAKVMCACFREQVPRPLNSGALEFDPDE